MKEGYLPRNCEALVVCKMKEEIIKSSIKYQVGGQPGQSPKYVLCEESVGLAGDGGLGQDINLGRY